MGLFDDILVDPVEPNVDRIDIAKQGIALQTKTLQRIAALPAPGKTPRGVDLLLRCTNPPEFTPERMAAFLEAYAEVPSEHRAAWRAGVTVLQVRQARRDDAGFAQACDLAQGLASGLAEEEAWRRAIQGCDTPILYQGAPTGFVKTEYSDVLMARILEAHDPKYEKKSNVKVDANVNMNWLELVQAMNSPRNPQEPG
jgi:hypothetical protein